MIVVERILAGGRLEHGPALELADLAVLLQELERGALEPRCARLCVLRVPEQQAAVLEVDVSPLQLLELTSPAGGRSSARS